MIMVSSEVPEIPIFTVTQNTYFLELQNQAGKEREAVFWTCYNKLLVSVGSWAENDA